MNDPAVPGTHTGAHDALAVGWVMHSLDAEEETAFTAHLATCPICRRIVDETTDTLGDVALAVEPAEPPPHLRQRLLDAVAAESGAAGAASPERRDETARAGTAPVVPLAARRRVSRWVLAAAVVLAVATVVGLGVANQELRAERDASAAAAAQAQRDASVVDVLREAGTPGVTHATLADPQGALVGLVVDDGTGRRVLATGLQANGSDEIYVLWGLAGGAPRPLGTFDLAGQEPAVRSVPSASEAGAFAGFAVSLEPGRTAPASPTRIVASGQVGR